MKGFFLVPNEAAVLVHFKGARKSQIPIPGGEAQLLGDASELFLLHWGHVELDKPLSPRDEHVMSVSGACGRAGTDPGTRRGLWHH